MSAKVTNKGKQMPKGKTNHPSKNAPSGKAMTKAPSPAKGMNKSAKKIK
jgi:hypothetical protein